VHGIVRSCHTDVTVSDFSIASRVMYSVARAGQK